MTAAQLRKVSSGDIVLCNIDGRAFLATVGRLDKRDGENGITIEPVRDKGSAVSHRWVSGKDVTTHYRRMA